MIEACSAMTAIGPKPICTTVRYLVVQSIAGQKPFMAFDNVPKAAIEIFKLIAQDLSFNVMSISVKSNLNDDHRMLEKTGNCHLSDLSHWIFNERDRQVGLGGKLTLPPDEQSGSDDHHTAKDHGAVKSLTNHRDTQTNPE